MERRIWGDPTAKCTNGLSGCSAGPAHVFCRVTRPHSIHTAAAKTKIIWLTSARQTYSSIHIGYPLSNRSVRFGWARLLPKFQGWGGEGFVVLGDSVTQFPSIWDGVEMLLMIKTLMTKSLYKISIKGYFFVYITLKNQNVCTIHTYLGLLIFQELNFLNEGGI